MALRRGVRCNLTNALTPTHSHPCLPHYLYVSPTNFLSYSRLAQSDSLFLCLSVSLGFCLSFALISLSHVCTLSEPFAPGCMMIRAHRWICHIS